MTKQEKEYYSKKEAVATYCLSNWGGIEILDILYGIDDYAVVRYYGESYHRVKVNYLANGDSYFRIGRLRIKLSECMRCGR